MLPSDKLAKCCGELPVAYDEVSKGTIMFGVPAGEMIRLEPNGDIYIKGKLVENDKEVVDGMRQFLESVR